MDNITLTADQQAAKDKFLAFMLDPSEVAFVLEGYSGTGKSTLIKTLLDEIPKIQKTIKLLNAKAKVSELEVMLTATTNKAAENFSLITGMAAGTIHSALGLMVRTDWATGETSVTVNKRKVNDPVTDKLLFIDEASYIDSKLLSLIFKQTKRCKIVFIGDPAQLTPVKSLSTPVFSANFPKATLSEVVRQASEAGKPLHPITDLATKFRHTVNTGKFFNFKPDGHHIQVLNRESFNNRLLVEFKRDSWRHRDSKLLAWTNKCVVAYNQAIAEEVKQNPDFQVGDYAICNKFVVGKHATLKTDQQVLISGIGPEILCHEVKGRMITVNGNSEFFFPNSLAEKQARLREALNNDEWGVSQEIGNTWIDLRHEYAQTVNKSQGSTYDMVFIDLDDIRRCNSGDQIARMLYVAVSRARNHVFLTGDLV